MRYRKLILAVFALSICATASFAADAPSFTDYPKEADWNGLAPKLRMKKGFVWDYRTQLREVSKSPPNFAGHYSVGTWGCGTGGCLYGGVVDLNTGEALEFPQTTVQTLASEGLEGAGVRYDFQSRLMVFRGIANEDGEPVANSYVIEASAFRLVHSETLSPEKPPVEQPQPLTFKGYDCTTDCSGHEAGYKWAEDNDISDTVDCGGSSTSFIEGCEAYVAARD